MLYKILRQCARLAFKLYFRKVYIINAEVIPHDKPIILACNHPSAFLEACILAAYLPVSLHFFTRGDMFRMKRLHWFFKATHQIPIYRFRDGFAGLRENQSSFDRCYEILENNGTVLIFSEAQTVLEKKLKRIQKGTAKLAFGALERNANLDLQIVPLGVSYGDPQKPGSYAMFSFAPPIPLRRYWEEFKIDPKKTINDTTDLIYNAIRPRVVHIAIKEDVELVENLLTLHQTIYPEKNGMPISTNPAFLDAEMRIANSINEMDSSKKEEIKNHINRYQLLLENAGLSLENPGVEVSPVGGMFSAIFSLIVFLVAIPLNILPAWVMHFGVKKKVGSGPFFGPILSMGGFFLFLFYYFLVAGALSVWLGWQAVAVTFVIAMMGYFWLERIRHVRKWFAAVKYAALSSDKKSALHTAREHCLAVLE